MSTVRNRMPWIKSVAILMLGLLILAACGQSPQSTSDAAYNVGASAPDAFAMEEMAAEAPAAFDDDSLVRTSNQQQESSQDRLIIRTATMNIVVVDTEETLQTISNIADGAGGWVVSTNVYEVRDEAKEGDLTVRVPAEQFESILTRIRELSVRVESESSSGQDVTEEFVDLGSRLENLEATAARVRSFLEDARNVEDALAVNQELSRLEGEIEVIKGRMQYLSQSAAFSTIRIHLTPDILSQPFQVAGWTPVGVARDAIEALVEIMQGLASLGIWLVIVALPVGAITLVPLVLIWRWIRRRRGPETAVAAVE